MAIRFERFALSRPERIDPLPAGRPAGEVNYHGHRVSDPETRAKLGALAGLLGRTVHVTSGDRTPARQAALIAAGISNARNSYHLHGKAADIAVGEMRPEEVVPYARQAGFRGIGVYAGHLHVDTRPHDAAWVVAK